MQNLISPNGNENFRAADNLFFNNSFFKKKKKNKNGKNEFIFNEAKAWIIFQRIFPDPIANPS